MVLQFRLLGFDGVGWNGLCDASTFLVLICGFGFDKVCRVGINWLINFFSTLLDARRMLVYLDGAFVDIVHICLVEV